MEVTKNSIWILTNTEGLESGMYRVLEVMSNADCLILFPLNEGASQKRPCVKGLSVFLSWVDSGAACAGKFKLPSYLLVAETEILEKHKLRRDKNYDLISALVMDNQFLIDYSTLHRVPRTACYAKSKGVDGKGIIRLLNRYWRYGQSHMAMLPAFSNSGGPGKERKPVSGPLGAPKRRRTLSVTRSKKFILSDVDKDNFRKATKKYHLKPNGDNVSKTYKKLLRDYYSDEICLSDALNQPPIIPTLRQFGYWLKKLFSAEDLIKSRVTEREYLLNKRALLGSLSDVSPVPGSCFEIDATVADVHIVSSFGERYALGRPTIYSVVDRASRMIVGFHVSLYHASWRAARQALANCFLPKAEYCRGFGIDIDESEWPCAHIPQCLMCDNGEMIGLKPQALVVPLTELQLSPPYRPDFKGIVEQRFKILNAEVLHELLGTTRGGFVVRGSRDPRKDSILRASG